MLSWPAEDSSFFTHEGFDWEGIKKAAQYNLEAGEFKRGGSTITQQLAKNLYLSSERSLLRKAREALITRSLEQHLTKERILELYLNVAEWGQGIYGAEAAARHHFKKPAHDLTADEAAWLAAILPSPRRYDPLRKTNFLTRRHNRILKWITRGSPQTPQPPRLEAAPKSRGRAQNLSQNWSRSKSRQSLKTRSRQTVTTSRQPQSSLAHRISPTHACSV